MTEVVSSCECMCPLVHLQQECEPLTVSILTALLSSTLLSPVKKRSLSHLPCSLVTTLSDLSWLPLETLTLES